MERKEMDKRTVILLNGGGQAPFSSFHRIVRFFKKYKYDVICMELPFHGNDEMINDYKDVNYVEVFLNEFYGLYDRYNVIGVLGFSLGGFLILNALNDKRFNFKFAFVLGCGLIITEKEKQIMERFSTIEFFENMKWDNYMLKYNGQSWRKLLGYLNELIKMEDQIFIDHNNFVPNSDTHLLVGDKDKIINIELQKQFIKAKDKIELYEIKDCEHFDYFSKSWENTKNILEKIIKIHN